MKNNLLNEYAINAIGCFFVVLFNIATRMRRYVTENNDLTINPIKMKMHIISISEHVVQYGKSSAIIFHTEQNWV